ncbi:MAG: type II toxin-antitoxin system HigB family toxin [Dyadobacter sp.]|uniref:type II toxin-antitoxin system HigB family toxin n=1 Tax=Dyadobacter sp. TaxID=1914288 RepID=UPI001B1ABA2A|nr:type II toxin-antitoxin system HigB family toxin [Dyadobacter sp.]MBO9614076.1 type II toxin-antitoxin system HigB family toxin [Dyadobacter sp.]
MHIEGKRKLTQLKKKNLGNKRLIQAVDQLIDDLGGDAITSVDELLKIRKDADRVHSKGLYFFNLHVHRTLIFIHIGRNRAEVLWAGTHEEYVRTFKNNTNTIEKWFRANTTSN